MGWAVFPASGFKFTSSVAPMSDSESGHLSSHSLSSSRSQVQGGFLPPTRPRALWISSPGGLFPVACLGAVGFSETFFLHPQLPSHPSFLFHLLMALLPCSRWFLFPVISPPGRDFPSGTILHWVFLNLSRI
jgi:hypothetical protein